MKIVVASVLLLGALGATITGCSSADGTEERVATGTASLPLTATGTSGALYRLTAATFAVAGPTSGSFTTDGLPDSETVDIQLNAGAYQITLQPGWVMERTFNGATEPVQAALLSTNPLSFAIADQIITEVSFVFQVGDDVIQMGEGVLRLGIDVVETSAACASDADCGAGQICDLATSQCVAAPSTCNADADCAAGEWCFVSTSFGNFCVSTGSGGVGAACDPNDVFSCAAQHVCIDIGVGPTCHSLCTVAAPACAAGEVCAPFQTQDGTAGDVGACLVP